MGAAVGNLHGSAESGYTGTGANGWCADERGGSRDDRLLVRAVAHAQAVGVHARCTSRGRSSIAARSRLGTRLPAIAIEPPRGVSSVRSDVRHGLHSTVLWRTVGHRPQIALDRDELVVWQFPRSARLPWPTIAFVKVVRNLPRPRSPFGEAPKDHLLIVTTSGKNLRVIDDLEGIGLEELAQQITERRRLAH